jgi:PAP2 superfamily C-terminal
VFVLSLLIIASRKHYTVDVVVAWYVVPLVFFTFKRFWKVVRQAEPDGGWMPAPAGARFCFSFFFLWRLDRGASRCAFRFFPGGPCERSLCAFCYLFIFLAGPVGQSRIAF